MKPNNFTKQFQDHISFTYTCFDRIIVRGYILSLFQLGSVVNLLRNLNFKKLSQGVLGILFMHLSAGLSNTNMVHNYYGAMLSLSISLALVIAASEEADR